MTDENVAQGLAHFLSQEWHGPVSITNLRAASAGARRRNLLFDASHGAGIRTLVATIVPRPAMQAVPVSVEAASLELGRAAGMPVPEVVAVCEDPSIVGGPFFLTERVPGVTIPRQVLKLVDEHPGLGSALARDCGRALARLHAVDPASAPPQLRGPNHEADSEARRDGGESTAPQPSPGASGHSAAETALRNLEESLAGLLQPSPALTLGFKWLESNLPASSPAPAVLHGDFRNGNLIVGPEGLRGVLDWEIARLGDPMEDLAWLCVRMWRFRNDALEVGGFARRQDLQQGYEEAGGTFRGESLHWWKTLGTLRWGLGLAAQAAAHIRGSVPSIVMAASGRRVAELEYDTLMLIRKAFD